MLTTNNCEIWEKAWSYKDHGKSYDAVYNRNHAPGFRWLHEDFGTNWRMTEMQAAIGRIQLRKLPDWISARRRNANILIDHLSEYSCLRIPVPEAHIRHAYYKLYVYIHEEELKEGWSRDRIMMECNQSGIPCFSGICGEIYLEKAFAKRNFQPSKRLEVARRLSETSLMFLVHPTLSERDMHRMADVVCGVLAAATKGASLADAA
jgi:dTDP-4-amino-4,6-dideoxygalactose transaminase